MPQVQIIEATYPISHVGIKRVAAYVRVSSSSEDQLNSYAFQIMRYQEIEKEHDDWRLVDIYADEGITGTRLDKREEFNRLLQDCRQGKIDLIITKSVARFARNMADCLVTLRELKALGITVIFEADHINTDRIPQIPNRVDFAAGSHLRADGSIGEEHKVGETGVSDGRKQCLAAGFCADRREDCKDAEAQKQ